MIPVLLTLGGALLTAYVFLRRRTGGPLWGITVHSDTLIRRKKYLVSKKSFLRGTPDYIERTPKGFIPVEYKGRNAPASPPLSHVYQVLAYCILVEDEFGSAPPFGRIRYRDRAFDIPYDRQQRLEVIRVTNQIRMIPHGKARRSHDNPRQCRACSVRESCPSSLA